jgi:hypothetical protein
MKKPQSLCTNNTHKVKSSQAVWIYSVSRSQVLQIVQSRSSARFNMNSSKNELQYINAIQLPDQSTDAKVNLVNDCWIKTVFKDHCDARWNEKQQNFA